MEVKDKLQNGNDVLGGQKKLVENLNSRFKKKKKVSCEFKSVMSYLNMTTNPSFSTVKELEITG